MMTDDKRNNGFQKQKDGYLDSLEAKLQRLKAAKTNLKPKDMIHDLQDLNKHQMDIFLNQIQSKSAPKSQILLSTGFENNFVSSGNSFITSGEEKLEYNILQKRLKPESIALTAEELQKLIDNEHTNAEKNQ